MAGLKTSVYESGALNKTKCEAASLWIVAENDSLRFG
jgi:hypothetical protein